ncbi:1-aminocyclopropane-1-carboxylate deaminase/D-cysteine desulfhydrase [Streptomyces sp. NPDC001380]|uniref:1-aminocyclopropane-1-carboxylate deaminase/D-cysteine desulfhydrase n=1 Tax=Streptomyces sp. NPDC001380 TaxID=3364566 RepID=UPI0036B5A89A
MLAPAALPSPLQQVDDPVLARAGVRLRLKRDDLVHPSVPGNKWRKLVPNLHAAADAGHTRLLAFGGAYSNLLRAAAAAAAAHGMASTGIVRGEELADRPRNWSLRAAEAYGMELAFLPRSAYRATLEGLADLGVRRALEERWGRCWILPEGGTNVHAARGSAATAAELTDLGPDDLVCCPVGTGGTLAGLAAGLPPGARALGVAVVAGARHLDGEVARLHAEGWGRSFANWRIDHDHHGGGYGRVPPALADFAAGFALRHGTALELRYVAKTLHAVYRLAEAGRLRPGTRVTAVVTGPPDPVPA